jgi:hypothetical protein
LAARRELLTEGWRKLHKKEYYNMSDKVIPMLNFEPRSEDELENGGLTPRIPNLGAKCTK